MTGSEASRIMLKKAYQKFRSAELNLSAGNFDSAVGDLYYSAFQTVCALMIAHGKDVTKHTHVRAFVNKELVRVGLLSPELGQMYNKLMDKRSDADYSTEVEATEEQVKFLLPLVKELNTQIEGLIEKK